MSQFYNVRNKFSIVLFITSFMLIELNYGQLDFNFGNLFVFITALFLFIKTHFRDYKFLKDNIYFDKSVLPYMILIILYLLSSLWSYSKVDTFVQFSYAFGIFLGVLALSKYDLKYISRIVIVCAFFISLLSIIVAFLFPSFAFQPHSSTGFPELKGILKHQQRLALNMGAVLGIYFICYKNKIIKEVLGGAFFKIRYVLILTISVAFLWAQARLFTVFVLISIILILSHKKFKRLIVLSTFFIVVVVFINLNIIIDFLLYYDGEETLTGRTMIWNRTYIVSLDEFFFGHGFSVFNAPYFDYLWSDYRPPHAHNSFIQSLFDLGLIGLIIMCWVIYSNYLIGHNFQSLFKLYSTALFLTTLGFLSSLTGVVYFGKPSAMLCLILIYTISEARVLNDFKVKL